MSAKDRSVATRQRDAATWRQNVLPRRETDDGRLARMMADLNVDAAAERLQQAQADVGGTPAWLTDDPDERRDWALNEIQSTIGWMPWSRRLFETEASQQLGHPASREEIMAYAQQASDAKEARRRAAHRTRVAWGEVSPYERDRVKRELWRQLGRAPTHDQVTAALLLSHDCWVRCINPRLPMF